MSIYDALLKPIKINGMTLKNRMIMSPVTTLYPDENFGVSQKMIDYFAERAKGGAAMVTTEACYLDKRLTTGFPSVVIDREFAIPKLSDLADAVHLYGCKLCIQVGAGSGRNELLVDPANPPRSASATPSIGNPDVLCKPFTIEEIKDIVRMYGETAARIKMSGADAINIHAHNGYIIDQFMSEVWNQRTDEYGGSFENRMRLAAEIVETVRSVCGPDFPIIFRISLDHKFEGGRKPEDSIKMLQYLQEKGVDAFDIDAGAYESLDYIFNPYYLGDACQYDVAPGVKEAGITVPLINTGNHTIDTAAQMISDGVVDIAQFGRSFLADPEFPNKVADGHNEKIRPCIRCNEFCTNRMLGFRPITCAVNYQVGHEKQFEISKAATPRNVVVIGGGPGGMEAARVCALKGHKVTLYEKGETLGGMINYAATPAFKNMLKKYVIWQAETIQELGVRVTLNTEIGAEDVVLKEADYIIYAGGSAPVKPPIPGLDKGLEIKEAHQLAMNGKLDAESILIAGGGLSGCDFGIEMVQAGKKVTVIEMMDDIANDMGMVNKISLGRLIAQYGLDIQTGHRVTAFTDEGIETEIVATGETELFKGDLIVYSFGTKPLSGLGKELTDRYGSKVIVIGDASKTGKVGDAVHSGFEAAFCIR